MITSQNIEQGQRQNSGQPVAFHGSSKEKEKVVQQLIDDSHGRNGRQLRTGFYYKVEDGKTQVCVLGSFLGSLANMPARYDLTSKRIGVPAWFAGLYEIVFESHILHDNAADTAVDFLESIPVGFDDWERVYEEFVANKLFALEQRGEDIGHINSRLDAVTTLSSIISYKEFINLGRDVIAYFHRHTDDAQRTGTL